MNHTQPELDIDIAPTATPDQQERDRVREVYRARLAEKLEDPEFRKIEGFPLGTDEAILALSDPPYYTACPNPFLEEWLQENAIPYDATTDDATTDDYHREPFAADVSEGKNDPIYNAHSYHTKVPHKAIMRYILHYTEPGDAVYDGFCGTGMTGVAAQMCGNKAQVESLGYSVTANGSIMDVDGRHISRLGARKAILNDLSPAATFIAYNYNTPVDAAAFAREAKRILAEVEAECGWMYTALHKASEGETERIAKAVWACSSADELRKLYNQLSSPHCALRDVNSVMQIGSINYSVWSEIFICPSCAGEIVFWNAAVNEVEGKVLDKFLCPSCRAETTKRLCGRAVSTYFDKSLQKTVTQTKQAQVLLNYHVGRKRKNRKPDLHDFALVEKINLLEASYPFPTDRMPEGDESRRNDSAGLSHAHHFYTKRNLWILAAFAAHGKQATFKWLVTAVMQRSSRQHQIAITRIGGEKAGIGGATAGHRRGTLYIPSNQVEYQPLEALTERINVVSKMVASTARLPRSCVVSTHSATANLIPSNSVAYLFVDPPFGANIMYSELNFLWESFLKVYTSTEKEAISNRSQCKGIPQYQELMRQSFENFYRVLRPGHWMTVEFHNSANAVWNSIQESLTRVGFVVADVRLLNKKLETHTQRTAAAAVNQDLVINCYKPQADFEQRFQQVKGQVEGVLEFVRQHLTMLPVAPIIKSGKLEPVAERTRFLLFDRMIAYHLQRGAPIPMDSAAFYKLLEDQFTTRDEMYFLPDQAARYDALKSRGYETEQLSIFLQDEKSAVQWVRAELSEKPQTLGDLTPKFMQELREWPAHEPRPELRDLLREYFIQSDSGVWRVPNPADEKDIEVLRKSALLRLFQGYTKEKGALKTFRKEAVMEGFKQCYETNQYGVIVAVCEKIPEKVFQEIPEFVMFYDIAKDLVPERVEQTEFVWE